MKYSEYLEQHKRKFWSTCEGKVAVSKHLCKTMAQALKIPVPKTYELPANSFFKPDRKWGGKGCQEILDPSDFILEERIEHDYDYRAFVVGGKVRLFQVDASKQGEGCYLITGQSYYRWSDWVKLDADTTLHGNPVRSISVDKPSELQVDKMVEYAERLGSQFSLPMRVDFMIDPSGKVYFNELCATPGLIVNNRVTEEVDEWLGSFINPAQNAVQ